jgi:DNA-binding transcriptional ArsR family regulator
LTNNNRMVIVLLMSGPAADPVFKALSDPTRRALFERLTREGELTVHALTTTSGVSQPMVSKHLTVLKRARLVHHRRAGRETHYTADPKALAPLFDWMSHYGAFWLERFDRLESLLKTMEPESK